MKVLVIVESSTKEKTIKKCLDDVFKNQNKSFIVKACGGHVCDLVKENFGLNTKTLQPIYAILPEKKNIIKALKDLVKQVDASNGLTLLASDNDREGEAIAWHLQNILKPKKYQRILFNEITKDGLYRAVTNPTEIDMKMVNSQQTRRVMDRLVGFNLTKMLWQHFSSSGQLSAGRVQSVVLMLIAQKENEIKQFVSEQYWNMLNTFDNQIKDAKLYKNDKIYIFKQKNELLNTLQLLKDVDVYTIQSHQHKDVLEYPDKPFTTSTLQQKASTHGFTIKKTMKVAQELYELGHITYMRTDSFALSNEFQKQLSGYIEQTYGTQYVNTGRTKNVKNQKNAQEAHEAIRPTKLQRLTGLSKDQHELYTIIFNRTVASMMIPAVFKELTMNIVHEKLSKHLYFLGKSKYILELGFKRAYSESEKNYSLSDIEKMFKQLTNQPRIRSLEVVGNCIWSVPPPRYNEAFIIKKMEELGIGRPSTYVSILNKLYERQFIVKTDKSGEEKTYTDYILKKRKFVEHVVSKELYVEKNRIVPSEAGFKVVEFLVAKFGDIVNVEFTSNMETKLDEIASGTNTYDILINQFYKYILDKCVVNKREKSSEKSKLDKKQKSFNIDQREVIIRSARYGPVIEIPSSTESKSMYIPLSPYLKLKKMTEWSELKDTDVSFLLQFPVKYKHYTIQYKSYGFFVDDGKTTMSIFRNHFDDLCARKYQFVDLMYNKIK